MDQPYELSINAINARWAKAENIDDWSQLVIKYTDNNVELVTEAPRSGIYRIQNNGKIEYDRMDTHRRAVEKENEAFFLRITRKGDYLYEGADMGILVLRGRLMTDDFTLTARAKKWINAIKTEYISEEPKTLDKHETHLAEIGGFKMM